MAPVGAADGGRQGSGPQSQAVPEAPGAQGGEGGSLSLQALHAARPSARACAAQGAAVPGQPAL